MKIVQLTTTNHQAVIDAAIAVLRQGGLLIYPTETCYGIGADATNQAAIDKLLRYKTKRADKPLSVAVSGLSMAEQYVEIGPTARNLYEHFLPGPITVVSPSKQRLAQGVGSSQGTQGIRVPAYPLVLELVEQFGAPITATSANASYKKTPYTIADVLNNTSHRQQALVDLIIDAGTLPTRKPSTIVDTTLDHMSIIRQGDLELPGAQVLIAYSLADTEQFAQHLCTQLASAIGKHTIVFLLNGAMGAGKTHLSKFLAQQFGVRDVVTSPTFTICQEYNGQVDASALKFYHLDTYRLQKPSEIDGLRPQEIFQAPHIVVIEWANNVREHIQQYLTGAVVVQITITSPDQDTRRFEYTIT